MRETRAIVARPSGCSEQLPVQSRPGSRFLLVTSPILAVLFGLIGCSLGPNYKRPGLDVPQSFRDAPPVVSTNSLADVKWWQIFKDENLQNLVRTALTNNYDLRIAMSRVDQARAILAENRSLFFPQANYNASIGRGKNAAAGSALFNSGATVSGYAVSANASWEIDLWGRIRRLNESARAQFFANEENRRFVLISLISEVAQAYFQLLALDQQLEIAKRSTNSFGESYRIFGQRFEGGVVSQLETSAAEASLASAAATVPLFERQIAAQENLLNVLVGRNPGPVARSQTLLQQFMPPAIPAGLPSSLLERRPDIRLTEQLLRSANAQIGVAVADFFPQISLTALFGQVSPELSIFTSGTANAWSVAAGAAGPLFQGGRLVAEYRQAVAAREEARLRYQSTVLNAFQEVSDSLISVQKYAEARVQQQHAVKAYEVAVQVSMERYVAGRASYYEVLQEQQLLFPAENNLVQTELNQYLAVVELYLALGGGFDSTDNKEASR